MRREWLTPLTGVVFIVLVIVGFAVGGEPPDVESPVQEIVDFYTDNKDSVSVGAVIVGLAAVFFLFFAGYLRQVLRAAEGEGGMLSAVALVGAAVMAVGIGIDATVSLALAAAAEDVEPQAVQALQAFWDNDFLPIAIGLATFLVASGISIVRYGALPRWLGWVALALVVISLTPIGFIGFIGGAVWVLVVSVMLALRARPARGVAPG